VSKYLHIIISLTILACFQQAVASVVMPYQMGDMHANQAQATHSNHAQMQAKTHSAEHGKSHHPQQVAASEQMPADCHSDSQSPNTACLDSCDCCPALCSSAYLTTNLIFAFNGNDENSSATYLKNPIKRALALLLPPIIA
jgi:hypothetical protein